MRTHALGLELNTLVTPKTRPVIRGTLGHPANHKAFRHTLGPAVLFGSWWQRQRAKTTNLGVFPLHPTIATRRYTHPTNATRRYSISARKYQ